MCNPDILNGASSGLQPIPQGDGSEGSGLTPDQVFARNKPYLKPGASNFTTQLAPDEEGAFRNWVAQNHVAFDPAQTTPDYDMRGFWKQNAGGGTAVNPNDGKIHYPDTFKTPYDLTFSRESQFAAPSAPAWNDKDQLVTPDGKIQYDERARKYRPSN